jgi:outer membrane protein assembly factor BamA
VKASRLRITRLAAFALSFVVSAARPALADDSDGDGDAKAPKTEFTPAPLVGASSDVGYGGGVIASLARLEPGYHPYLYRLELVSTTMVKSQNGSLTVPYEDDYLLVSLPNIVKGRMKLDLRAAYTREATLKYYGIGDAAKIPSNVSLDDPFYEYDRTHPTLSADATVRVVGPIALELWLSYTQNWITVPPGTKLYDDKNPGDPTVRSLIPTFAEHGVFTLSYGVEFDTRDDEVSPTRGEWLTSRADLSPGGTSGIPQRWGRWNTSLRWYVPAGTEGSAFAVRVVSDLLFGDAPFYELGRFDSTGAFGGPNGVRGVPAQRYSGKIKVFGNVELRETIFHFHLLGKNNGFQVAAFADAGRLWATYASHPELDGTSLGLKLGLGGGVRVVGGKSFVLRGDLAWSPDARPIGGYVAAGQAF